MAKMDTLDLQTQATKLSRDKWLSQDRFFPTGGAFTRHQARIPIGTPRSDLLRGEYWTRHLRALHPDDRIEFVYDDRSAMGELVVTHHDIAGELEIVELWFKELRPTDYVSRRRGDLEIVWLGAHEKWGIKRGDGVLLEKGIRDAAEAERRSLEILPRKIA